MNLNIMGIDSDLESSKLGEGSIIEGGIIGCMVTMKPLGGR